MRTALLALLLAVAAPAAASAFYEPVSERGDLDGDGVAEEVRTVEAGDDRTAVNVTDSCGLDRRIAGVQDSLAFLKLLQADGLPGREVFIDLRSGATARVGEARVVALRDPDGDGCGTPRQLWTYKRPTRRPGGAAFFASFGAVVRDFDRRRAGREIRLDEHFARRGEAPCCPSIRKRSWYRFDSSRDRYVRYRTQVTRRPSNG